MAKKPKPPIKGDLVKVTWRDIYEDSTGNPSQAKTMVRVSFGLFVCQEMRDGIETLVTTTTADPDGDAQCGWCAYPVGAVAKIEVMKRASSH